MCWGHTTSQVDYPNPNSNGDSLIGLSDLIDMLTTSGGPFQPAPITLEDEPLESILTTFIQQVNALQTQVADLESEVVSKDSIMALTWGKSFVNPTDTTVRKRINCRYLIRIQTLQYIV